MNKQYENVAFRLALGLKDVNLVLDNAEKANTSLPLANLVRNRLQKSIAAGDADLDWSAFAKQVEFESKV